VDLVKDPQILHDAYNDRAGITAAFNKNLLARANREAGANFDLANFAHYALYNPLQRRIEMYLVCSVAQRATVCGRSIAFSEGEAIHTEYSYKYTVDDFRSMAASAGFIPRKVWCDADRLFSIHWLETK
jgi:L-histidine N-alpha-methyltransferase